MRWKECQTTIRGLRNHVQHGKHAIAKLGTQIKMLFSSKYLLAAALINSTLRISTIGIGAQSNPAITVSTQQSGQLNHISNKFVSITTHHVYMSVFRTILCQYLTRSAFQEFEPAMYMINAGATTNRTRKFPLAASFTAYLWSPKSDTVLLNYGFFVRRRFSSFNWPMPIPQYCLRQR